MDLTINIDVPYLDAAEALHAEAFGLQLADPFGHGWCLVQLLGRGYDEIATP